jgi:hypothetical protein
MLIATPEVSWSGRNSAPRFSFRAYALAIVVCLISAVMASAQVSVTTSRNDNTRSGANPNETLLTLSNVNTNSFGLLFNYNIDYQALAQPLYMPNVNIANQGTYNVVYVATMADSVYAFDADSNGGSPNNYLWWVNFTDPANGITTASGPDLPCSGGKTTGFTQEGIAGTPVIDPTTGTLYLVAKIVNNGVVQHWLHALDITSGAEKFGGPIQIQAQTTYVSPINGQTYITTFTSLHQLNRPGLMLLNGVLYLGFGSNGCNDDNTGWLLSYSASTLDQIAVFNTSPEHGLTSIWQTGNGVAADEFNNIYFETAEACPTCYDVPEGGATYSNSVLQVDPNSVQVTDYFTPDDVEFLNANDLDLSSTGALILPDLDNPQYPHVLVAGGKEGFVYLINRDSMGGYNSDSNNVLQTIALIPGTQTNSVRNILFSSPAYWNNTVYFTPDASPILAYPVQDSTNPPSLGTPLQTTKEYVGSHSPSISANGTANGILWNLSGGNLYAFNAITMQELYGSNQNKARDGMPALAHFAAQIVANGKVYVATTETLQAYGLFQAIQLNGGGNQSGQVLTQLPNPIQVQVIDPYSGNGISGATVTFSDGGKGGVFNPASGVSDQNGNVSTYYTLPKVAGNYTLTASSTEAGSLSIIETATAAPASKMIVFSGSKQSGQAGSILPSPLRVKVEDAYSNGVPGVTVTFVDVQGLGTLNPTSAVSNSLGQASVSYQLPNTDGTYKIDANAPSLKSALFSETATGDSPASLVIVSGNNQSAQENSALPQPLVVQVNDAGGNPISGVDVVFSAPSGSFTGSPAVSGANGQASVSYTTGSSSGTVTITAAVNGVTVQFTATVTGFDPAAKTASKR